MSHDENRSLAVPVSDHRRATNGIDFSYFCFSPHQISHNVKQQKTAPADTFETVIIFLISYGLRTTTGKMCKIQFFLQVLTTIRLSRYSTAQRDILDQKR